MTDLCRHGHEWSTNTYVYPDGGRRCRACHAATAARRRERNRPPQRPRPGWLSRLILATLAQHPGGVSPRQLRAKIGYRSTPTSIRVTVWDLRHRKGAPIASVRTGNDWRYVLQEGAA